MNKEYHVFIKPDLYELIQKRLAQSSNEFDTADDYVNFILSEVLSDDESLNNELEDDETKKVEDELKKLGYI
jgi:hypothetical protein